MGKREVKLSLSTDDMILPIEKPKDSTQTMLELICEFSKVSGHKINIQKPVAFHTSIKTNKGEIKKTIPFAIALKKKNP